MGTGQAGGAAKKVVIADPAEAARRSLSRFLRKKGMEVIEAPDGSKALAETLLKRPDILLLDLSVAVLSADRLVQILHTNPNTKSMPIFFFGDKENSVSGFRPGLDEFLHKPFRDEEVLTRIQRSLFRDNRGEAFAGDSEISGNLAQIFLPDLWQMLSMHRKSGIIQIESNGISGSVYIDKGEILSAVSRNLSGEKALFRMVPLKSGKFRFLPGKVDVRRTIFTPTQQAVLEGLRQHDELKQMSGELPSPDDPVAVSSDARAIGGAGGVVREVLLLAEFCNSVGEILNHCNYPDLLVYQTLLHLKKRGLLRIGGLTRRVEKSQFLPPEDLARLRTRLDDRGSGTGRSEGRVVLFFPDAELLESAVLALGKFREFEIDSSFLTLRRKEGIPLGIIGAIRMGEASRLLLYAFPYQRCTSPIWYALAPRPIGVIAFLKDEVSSSLDGLMAVSDFTHGSEARVLLAVMGKTFTNFGLGENTIRLFRNRAEKLGCTLKTMEMEKMAPAEIRDAFTSVVRQYIEGDH